MSIASATGLGLTVLFVLILGVSTLWGMLRGLAKARIRGISILVCAIAAVVTAITLRSTVVSDATVEQILIPFLESNGMKEVAELFGLSHTLNEVLLHTVYSIVSPLLVLISFIVFSFVTWFVFLIVTLVFGGALRRHNERSKFSRIRALVWGAVQGLVIFVIILIPISATVELAVPIADAVSEAGMLGEDQAELEQTLKTESNAVNGNAFLVTYRALGGDALTDALTGFTINGNATQLDQEITSVAAFACNIYKLSGTEFAKYSSAEAVTIVALADSFDDSVMLSTIAGEIIYNATESWLGGNVFLGVAKPSFGESDELFVPFFDALLRILNTDAKNITALQADVHTVAEMIAVMAEHEVFGNLSNIELLLEKMSSQGITAKLVEKLGANESMKILIPELTNLGMRAIATTLGIPTDVTQVYGSLMDDIATALNDASDLSDDEQISAITADLITAFDNAGVKIDRELIDGYSVSMIKDLLEDNTTGKSLTAEDVQAFFAVYAMQVAEETDGGGDPTDGLSAGGSFALEEETDIFVGTVYEGKTEAELRSSGAAVLSNAMQELAKLEAPDPEQAKTILTTTYSELLSGNDAALNRIASMEVKTTVSNDSLKATSGLQSSETIVTVKMTLTDLLTDTTSAAEAITPETLQKEAEAISSIFDAASGLMKTVSNAEQKEMDIKTIAGSVGTILDSLQSTASVGSETTGKLFTAVLQSETVREAADLDMMTATQMAQKATEGENVNYSQTMNTVSSGVDLFTKLDKNGGELSEEEIIDLIRNINPSTAGMIEVYITAERIVGYGVPEKYADTSAALISNTFAYMADTEMSEEEYAKEAKALNQMLTLAISARSSKQESSNKKPLFGENGYLPSATESVDIFMESGAVTYAIRSVMLDENGNVIEAKRDAFGLSEQIPENSTEYHELITALESYLGDHQDATTKLTVKALSALFDVPVNFN